MCGNEVSNSYVHYEFKSYFKQLISYNFFSFLCTLSSTVSSTTSFYMFKAFILTGVLLKKGFYSPEYYQLYSKLRTNDYRQAFAVKPAIDDRFSDHFNSVESILESTSTKVDYPLDINKIPFNSTFSQFVKVYGKPQLFNACYEMGVPLRAAAYRGNSGSLLYKSVFFFVGKSFVLSEFSVYNGSDEQQKQFMDLVLKSKNIEIPKTTGFPVKLQNRDQEILHLEQHPFKLTATCFVASDRLLLETTRTMIDVRKTSDVAMSNVANVVV